MTAEEWLAVRLSCIVGVYVVLVSLPFATALGYALARFQFQGKWLVEIVLNLPLVMPPVVTGYLLLLTFGREAFLGRLLRQYFGIRIALDWKGLVVAAAVMSFPLMVRAIRLGFQGVDVRLETAARTLGAGRLVTFFTVSLPLARSGILAGAVLAFARSLGEFGATVMLVSQREGTQTIPLLVYQLSNQYDAASRIWGLVLISIVLAGAALAASEYLERKGIQRESA